MQTNSVGLPRLLSLQLAHYLGTPCGEFILAFRHDFSMSLSLSLFMIHPHWPELDLQRCLLLIHKRHDVLFSLPIFPTLFYVCRLTCITIYLLLLFSFCVNRAKMCDEPYELLLFFFVVICLLLAAVLKSLGICRFESSGSNNLIMALLSISILVWRASLFSCFWDRQTY